LEEVCEVADNDKAPCCGGGAKPVEKKGACCGAPKKSGGWLASIFKPASK